MAATKQNVLQRINSVMKELKYVRKTASINMGGKYMAVTHDEVAKKVHVVMAKHGLIAVPSLISDSMAPSGMVTSNGNIIFLYQCIYDVHFYGIDNMDEVVTARVSAHANDMSDKAAGKALSYAVKYAYLKVFCLETGEDDEERVEGNVAPISEEQLVEMTDLCDSLGFPVKETLHALATKVYQIKSGEIAELSSAHFDNAMKRLNKKAADAKRAQEKKTPAKKAAPKKVAKKKAAPKQKPEEDPFGGES